MQDVGAKSHQLYIRRSTVNALSVHDRPLEHVAEFSLRAEIVWPDEIHHAPVFQQVVLQWISGQDHTSSGYQNHYVKLRKTGRQRKSILFASFFS